jgi:hypothetical protein
VTGSGTFGYCTGCALAGTTQAEHDAACNCFGHTGKFCDTSDTNYPEGVCRDCTQLSTTGECGLHDTVCCIDGKNSDACRGGDGTLVAGFPGYCAYYDCQIINPSVCDSGNPTITGKYRTIELCDSGCQSSVVGPQGGRSCYSGTDNLCTIICNTGYACLGDDGCLDNVGPWPAGCGPNNTHDCRCCCDPNNDLCDTLNPEYPALVCQPDQSPCTGSERGLCCGCEEDINCGNINNVGCGSDTCCHARPSVIAPVVPADDTTDICRNTVITAEFDQLMNISSFSGNVMVVGDYGSSPCPEGTVYLTSNKEIKANNIFTQVFSKIARAVARIIRPTLPSRLAKAYTNPSGTNNYCAITGSVSGYNNAANHSVLEFRLSRALDSNRLYYAIIKGDDDLSDGISKGVENRWGVSMNGPADSNNTFNVLTYNNSYIWSFTTGPYICQIDDITINPDSYLFQEVNQIQDFIAEPKASDGQVIVPITSVYNWAWEWSSDNENVAIVTNSDNSQQTVTSQNVKDGRTYIKAIATISEDTVISPSTVGQFKTGQAAVYVFLCANPWPPRATDGSWAPWRDDTDGMSCVSGTGACHNTNYEIYYCRDDGSVGTADDLPAVLSDNTVIRGETGDIFKEAYFFREEIPSGSTTGLEATNTPGALEGGSVDLNWGSVSGAIGYKLYWGTNSGSYTNYEDVGNVTSYTTEGLTNDVLYYFNFTSYGSGMAETDYYGEVEIIPTDEEPPDPPIGFTATSSDREVELSWDANPDDTESYEIYYGVNAGGPYGYSENIGSDTAVIIAGLTNGTTYYFRVRAVDAYGNKSDYSQELSATPNP